MPTPKQAGWSFAAVTAALLAFFGYKAHTNPTPPQSIPDSTRVAPVSGSGQTTSTPPGVTPSQPSQPVSGTVIAHDDFSAYHTTADLMAKISKNVGGTGTSNVLYTDGVNVSQVSLDTTIQYHGHPTMKYSQPSGVPNTPQLAIGIPPQSHVWFKAVIRFSPGWTTVGTGGASAAYKVFSWGALGYDGSGRLEITNTNQYQIYWGFNHRNGATVVLAEGQNGVAGNVTTEWTDGGWYQYIIEVDYSHGHTGVARIYMGKDGATPVFKKANAATTSEATLPQVNAFWAGLNYNMTRTAAQSINYGEWEIATGDNPFGLTLP